MKSILSDAQIEELTTQTIAFAENIKNCKEPELLEAYYKVIKKNVSLSSRKYLAAYLLLTQGYKRSSKSFRKNDSRSSMNAKNKSNSAKKERNISKLNNDFKSQPHAINTTVHKDNTQTLFVGIGRNRKVFPQDLIALFSEQLNIPEEQFGLTKIFKTYSFIEVPEAICNDAIDKMNGFEFRKIKLKVNFSRGDHSEEETPSESSIEPAEMNIVENDIESSNVVIDEPTDSSVV